jgi:hypothetical protein
LIVRFSTKQYEALCKALPQPLQDYVIGQGIEPHEGKMLDIDLLPDVWYDIEILLVHSWQKRTMSPTLAAAAAHVVKTVRRYENHPAFKGEAVVGPQHQMLPGWRRDDGTISPFVKSWDHLDRLVLLEPVGRHQGRVKVTKWEICEGARIARERWEEYDRVVRRPA